MSNLKLCQGTQCHTYHTQDRLKGVKGNKTFQTRRRSNFYYGNGNFCDQRCLYDWINTHIEEALDYFGRTKEAKHLTEECAWQKTYDWDSDYTIRTFYLLNSITKERRSITEQQFDDNNYDINS
tara:strand:- start:96 stop:467 length:372 start_codon:yes stop_codon:yes gene_type:complete